MRFLTFSCVILDMNYTLAVAMPCNRLLFGEGFVLLVQKVGEGVFVHAAPPMYYPRIVTHVRYVDVQHHHQSQTMNSYVAL